MLLLAFGLGLAGQLASSAAMAAQMQDPAQTGISTGTLCPGCDGDMQHGCLAANCIVPSCWTVPALPPQDTALESQLAPIFPATTDAIVESLASAPDPHPPRVFLHS
jgi:hypothetical protein